MRSIATRFLPLVAALAAGLLVMGCAKLEVASRYEPERRPSPSNSKVVDADFDRAWDQFVRRLSQGFFNIQQVSKESRLISLTVDEQRLPDFVDCGRLTYEVNGETWQFDPTADSDFVRTSFGKETVLSHRVSGYVGRLNIFVAPQGSKTVFEVNATYELAMAQSGHNYRKNLIGDVVSARHWGDRQAYFRPTTTKPDEKPLGEVPIRCQSSGEWEAEILGLAY